MQQPWEEPAGPPPQGSENLPLAGLLAELLAGADPDGGRGGSPAGAGPAEEVPRGGLETEGPGMAPGSAEVAEWMRALSTAEQQRQETDTGLSDQLFARLFGQTDPGADAAGNPGEPPAAAFTGLADWNAAAEDGGLSRAQEAGEKEPLAASGPVPTLGGLDAASGPDVSAGLPSLPLREPETQGAGAPATRSSGAEEFAGIPAAAPAPVSPCPLIPAPAADSNNSASPADLPAAAADTESGGDAAPSGSALSAGREPAPAIPGRHPGSAIPAAGDEEDEFELVDAEMAGRMLDQLIDAARSAIRSSLEAALSPAAGPQPPSAAGEHRQAEPEATAGPPPALPAASAAQPASPPWRPVRLERAGGHEDLGEEPSPLPPAAALIGMGLPERLRARLESLGDLEKVLVLPPEEASGKTVDRRRRLLVFRVGTEYFGLPVEHVREVERVGRVTPVPGAPPFVRGLINLRGEILPLVDMRQVLGLAGGDAAAAPRLIVARPAAHEAPLALMVDELNGLAPVEAGPSPARETRPWPWVCGVIEHRGRNVWWLDPAAGLTLAALGERFGQP